MTPILFAWPPYCRDDQLSLGMATILTVYCIVYVQPQYTQSIISLYFSLFLLLPTGFPTFSLWYRSAPVANIKSRRFIGQCPMSEECWVQIQLILVVAPRLP